MTKHLEPVALPANQPPQFYRGGDAIAALRGATGTDSKLGAVERVGCV
ncbi:mannose-6-phosphate isomerase, partial [Amycolatopsis sp. NPDC059090]